MASSAANLLVGGLVGLAGLLFVGTRDDNKTNNRNTSANRSSSSASASSSSASSSSSSSSSSSTTTPTLVMPPTLTRDEEFEMSVILVEEEKVLSVLPQIECSICTSPLLDPVITACNHTFCKKCVTQMMTMAPNARCPSCRAAISRTSPLPLLKQVNSAMYQIFANVKVKCPINSTRGCVWQGTYDAIHDHIIKTCTARVGRCSLCQMEVTRGSWSAHQSSLCTYRTISCDDCKMMVRVSDMEHHLNVSCTMAKITCGGSNHTTTPNGRMAIAVPATPNTTDGKTEHKDVRTMNNGCGMVVLRKDLNHHLAKECPKAVITCEKFGGMGCKHRCARELLTDHYTNATSAHLELLYTAHLIKTKQCDDTAMKLMLMTDERDKEKASRIDMDRRLAVARAELNDMTINYHRTEHQVYELIDERDRYRSQATRAAAESKSLTSQLAATQQQLRTAQASIATATAAAAAAAASSSSSSSEKKKKGKGGNSGTKFCSHPGCYEEVPSHYRLCHQHYSTRAVPIYEQCTIMGCSKPKMKRNGGSRYCAKHHQQIASGEITVRSSTYDDL